VVKLDHCRRVFPFFAVLIMGLIFTAGMIKGELYTDDNGRYIVWFPDDWDRISVEGVDVAFVDPVEDSFKENINIISTHETGIRNTREYVLDVANEGIEEIQNYDPEAEDKLVTAILYRYSKHPFNQIRKLVKKMDQKSKEKIVDEFLNRMDKHDWPLRELEHIYYTFDVMIDYGAFRDIQRHRICTQTNQELTVEHGYDIPQEIIDLGFKKKFEDCMNMATEVFNEISKDFPKEAQYVVPLAFKKRTLFTWNLRELYHFIKLRSSKEGHISYRRIAQQVFDELEKVHPLLARYIRVDKSIGPSRG